MGHSLFITVKNTLAKDGPYQYRYVTVIFS